VDGRTRTRARSTPRVAGDQKEAARGWITSRSRASGEVLWRPGPGARCGLARGRKERSEGMGRCGISPRARWQGWQRRRRLVGGESTGGRSFSARVRVRFRGHVRARGRGERGARVSGRGDELYVGHQGWRGRSWPPAPSGGRAATSSCLERRGRR
jgi:hypothetical protein